MPWLQGTPEGVEDNGSLTRVAAFPIGIDPERFAQALEKPNVKAHIAQLLNRYAGRKVHLLASSPVQQNLQRLCCRDVHVPSSHCYTGRQVNMRIVFISLSGMR